MARGNGEGSIYQRKTDGKWCGALKDERGKRKVLYGRTREEVGKKLAQALAKRQQGLPVHFERQTVGAFLNDWLENTVKQTVRPSTYASYRRIVTLYIKPRIGQVQLAKLTPAEVQALVNGLQKPGVGTRKRKDDKEAPALSARTAQYTRAILRRALGQALKWGMAPRNVATLVDSPRVERPAVEPLNPDEARRFLTAVRGDRLEALYTVAVALGLRQGEALGLRWPDIDLDARTLRVAFQVQRIEGTLQLVQPKTKESRRTIPLPAVAVEALRSHRVRQLEERLQAGERWEDHGLVFTTRHGKPIDAVNLIREYQRHVKAAKIGRHIRFHDLRHTCATLLLVQGVPARVIMELLGHTQISTTLDIYSHVLPTLQQEAAAKMDALLSAAR